MFLKMASVEEIKKSSEYWRTKRIPPPWDGHAPNGRHWRWPHPKVNEELFLFFVKKLTADGVPVQGLQEEQRDAAIILQIVGHVSSPVVRELDENTLLHINLEVGHDVVSL